MAGNLTFAMIKPHIHFEKKVGSLIARIEEAGFGILICKMTQLLPEGAMDFYAEHKGKDFYANLIKVMSSGPVWALVLTKKDAVEEWRKLIGATDPAKAEPGTIRSDFGDHKNITNNAVHGSADDWAAKKEINFFFARDLKLTGVLGNALNHEPKLNIR